jgi:hypothetical protein
MLTIIGIKVNPNKIIAYQELIIIALLFFVWLRCIGRWQIKWLHSAPLYVMLSEMHTWRVIHFNGMSIG